jgi:LPS sulfotransferase NodH
VLLLSEARSGSTWIAELLAYHLDEHHGISMFDLTLEHFAGIQWNSSAQDVRDRLASLYVDPRGFRASKIFCPNMSVVCMLGQSDPRLLDAFFGPDTLWIVVRRGDRIAQAVSLAHAWTNDCFHRYEADQVAEATRVSPELVSDALSAILRSDVYLDAMIEKIPPDRRIVVRYEEVLQDHAAFLVAALKLLGLRVPTNPESLRDSTKLMKLGTDTKQEDQQRFIDWLLCNHHHVPPDLADTAQHAPAASALPARQRHLPGAPTA